MMFGQNGSGACPFCGAGYSTTDTLLLFLFGLLVVAGIIVFVIWLVRSGSHNQSAQQPPQPPQQQDASVQIARERLARGEITKEQYDELMRHLGGQ